MSTIVRGVHYDIGNRELYEDRVTALHLETAGELQLDVAIVADGVGGENRGERAAQVAIDACVDFLQNSTITDLALLISNAAQAANIAVNKIFQELEGASTTLSVAVVHAGRLYIANVGDSRVYLMRDNTLTLLTLDHTFANLVPIQGKMSAEKARNYPSAHVIMRALGPKSQIPIDIGLHFETENILTREAYMSAQEAGQTGLALEHGDSILVCTDGLTRESKATGEPSTSDEEIIQVLSSQAGEKAARSLVSFALGRDSDDNISVAVLQNLDEEELKARESASERQATSFRRFMIGAGVALFVLFAFSVIGAVIFYQTLINRETEVDELAAENTRAAEQIASEIEARQTAVAESARIRETTDAATLAAILSGEATQTVQAIIAATETAQPTASPTPTITPRPPLKDNQIGGYFLGQSTIAIDLFEDDFVKANQRVEFQINHTEEDLPSGSIYGFGGTAIEFDRVETAMEFEVLSGSRIFVETGRYEDGAEIDLFPDRLAFNLLGQCMSIEYDRTESRAEAACYSGTCRYEIERNAAPELLPVGQSMTVDLDTSEISFSPISELQSSEFEEMLAQSTGGQDDVNRCLTRYLPPTPIPTSTPTIFVATRTLEPTNTPTSTNTPSSSGQSGGGGGGSTSAPTTAVGQPLTTTPSSSPTTQTFVTSGVPFPTSTPSRTPTRTPAPTATDQPTSTPSRTNTPRPADTNTPPPTNTPAPTQTPLPNTSTPTPTDTPPASPTANAVEPNLNNVMTIFSLLFGSLIFSITIFPYQQRKIRSVKREKKKKENE
ncbi:MAG: protein phosphatase 2C domain-containing protein [Chloroflexota bacterium]